MRMSTFEHEKEHAISQLEKAIKNKEVDEKIVSVLKLINSHPDYFTTSSCAGRISLSTVPPGGKKKDHVFIKKWHRTVSYDELMEALPREWKGVLWLKMESFILHIGCRDMSAAEKIQKMAILLGLKRSGIFRISPFPMMEVIATDYVAAPIGEEGKLFVTKEYIGFIVNIMNQKMEENDKKLEKFYKEIKENLFGQ